MIGTLKRIRIASLLFGVALWAVAGTCARAGIVVVPSALASVEGNTNNGFPFNLDNFSVTSQRYQQVYASSQFPAGPLLITQIAFRPSAGAGAAFSSTLPNIRIDLSTTSAAPDALSTTYASNVGADDATVFNGALSLSSAFTGPGAGPKAFDIVISLTTPFTYNPGTGNLLLDVRNSGAGLTTQFDADNTFGSITSRVFNTDVNGATGTADSTGLVTQFTFGSGSPVVPEPHSVVLLVSGLVGLLGVSHLRRPR